MHLPEVVYYSQIKKEAFLHKYLLKMLSKEQKNENHPQYNRNIILYC